MSEVWAALIAAISGLIGAGLTYALGRYTARKSAEATEKTRALELQVAQRRDTIADRDALLKWLRDEVEGLRGRVGLLETRERAKGEHIDVLRRQIWERRPPPPDPPARPVLRGGRAVTEQPPAVPCMKCCALVRPADLRVHEAWHAGLIELVVAAAVLKLMKGSGN